MRADRLLRAARRRRGRRRRGRPPRPRRLERTADARLASGPGLVAAAFGHRSAGPGSTCANRRDRCGWRRPPPTRRQHRRSWPTPRIGISYAGEPWSAKPWRFVEPGHPSLSGPSLAGAEPRRDRSLVPRSPSHCSSSPRSVPRLAEATSFEPSRMLAEALEPSSDPIVVATVLDETDQARGLIEERPGIGIGAARDVGPGHRARGAAWEGATRPSSSRSPRRSTRPLRLPDVAGR